MTMEEWKDGNVILHFGEYPYHRTCSDERWKETIDEAKYVREHLNDNFYADVNEDNMRTNNVHELYSKVMLKLEKSDFHKKEYNEYEIANQTYEYSYRVNFILNPDDIIIQKSKCNILSGQVIEEDDEIIKYEDFDIENWLNWVE